MFFVNIWEFFNCFRLIIFSSINKGFFCIRSLSGLGNFFRLIIIGITDFILFGDPANKFILVRKFLTALQIFIHRNKFIKSYSQRFGMKMPSSEPDSQNYHQKYLNLKRKLKFLLYENESFQEELKKAQRKLLKVSRDKSFLLDRLLRYETVESSSSDSEATVSSDSDTEFRAELLTLKKKRTSVNTENQDINTASSSTNTVTNEAKKKKSRKTCSTKPVVNADVPKNVPNVKIEASAVNLGDGHMTSEEIERHLEAKQSLRDLIPEKTPLTVPVEMFSNEPSVMECEIIDGQVSNISPNTVVENVGIMIDIHE